MFRLLAVLAVVGVVGCGQPIEVNPETDAGASRPTVPPDAPLNAAFRGMWSGSIVFSPASRPSWGADMMIEAAPVLGELRVIMRCPDGSAFGVRAFGTGDVAEVGAIGTYCLLPEKSCGRSLLWYERATFTLSPSGNMEATFHGLLSECGVTETYEASFAGARWPF